MSLSANSCGLGRKHSTRQIGSGAVNFSGTSYPFGNHIASTLRKNGIIGREIQTMAISRTAFLAQIKLLTEGVDYESIKID